MKTKSTLKQPPICPKIGDYLVGVANAAKQLGLDESPLYDWRKKARYEAGRSELEIALPPRMRD